MTNSENDKTMKMNWKEAFTAGFIGGLATGIVLYDHYTDRVSVYLDDGRRSVPLMSGGETPDLTAELVKRWQELYGDEDHEERVAEAVQRGVEAATERDKEREPKWTTVHDLMADTNDEDQTHPHQQPNAYGWQGDGDEDEDPPIPEDLEAYQDIPLIQKLEEDGPMTAEELAVAISPNEHLEETFASIVEFILEKMEANGQVTRREDGRYVYHG